MRDVNKIYKVCGVLLVALLLICGCSRKSSPVTPLVDPDDTSLPSRIESAVSGEFVLGAYDVNISSDHKSVELLPIRNASDLGDSWTTELTYFFIANPCRDCFDIRGITLISSDLAWLRIYARHPFPQGNTFLPPTPKNRDDVRVFDTKLIVIDKNAEGIPFDAFGKRVSSSFVVNSAGMTDLIDKVYDPIGNKPNDTHPYVMLFEDSTEGNVDPASTTGFSNLSAAMGHNVMNQGAERESDLLLKLKPGENYELRFYIVANYGQSTNNYTERLVPRYYLPEFNAKEPWKVLVLVESNSLAAGEPESSADILVDVWDWQHGITPDPSLSALDSIRSSSDVDGVDVSVPGLFDGIITDTKPDVTGTGRQANPLQYRFKILNENSAPGGLYPGLVMVRDSRQLGGNTSSSDDAIRNSGFGLIPFDIPGFRTYQYFEVGFGPVQNIPPDARFVTQPSGDPLIIGRDEDIHYDATSSFDVDGGIASYEWDFDYDGTTFEPQAGHNSATGTWSYPTAGTYRMALRVTDNTIPIMDDIAYTWIVVLPEPSKIDARLICPISSTIGNLFYSSHNPIQISGTDVYIPIGGSPFGDRYIIKSTDYGANYSTPVKATPTLTSPSNRHVGGFDISSANELGYTYFDHDFVNPQSAWILLTRTNDYTTWPAGESLEDVTDTKYVVDSDMIYGSNDRMFIFFEMFEFFNPYGSVTLNYVHRASPLVPFQDSPILIKQSGLSTAHSRFQRIAAAVDQSGNVHLAFSEMILDSILADNCKTKYCRISPDGNTITRDITEVDPLTDGYSEKWLAIDTDGNNVYIVFSHMYALPQSADMMLVKSTNSGDTWTTNPVIITDSHMPSPMMEHPVNLAVDQNGHIHVTWADSRESGGTGYRDIWYDYSTDGGQTFHTDQQLYGDGIDGDQADPGIAVDNLNRVHIVWWNNDSAAGRGVWHTRFIN